MRRVSLSQPGAVVTRLFLFHHHSAQIIRRSITIFVYNSQQSLRGSTNRKGLTWALGACSTRCEASSIECFVRAKAIPTRARSTLERRNLVSCNDSNSQSTTQEGNERSGHTSLNLLRELLSRLDKSEDVVRSVRSAKSATQPLPDATSATGTFECLTLKRVASELCQTYNNLPAASFELKSLRDAQLSLREARTNHDRREVLLHYLAGSCGPDDDYLCSTVDSYHKHMTEHPEIFSDTSKGRSKVHLRQRLRDACSPRYEKVFRLILSQADKELGMPFLLQLRQDLQSTIVCLERCAHADWGHGTAMDKDEIETAIANMRQMGDDLRQMLSSWFNPSNLELRRITYAQTPASIIEKIAKKEAVHPLKNLADLRMRLGPNRRCFAFFHPSLLDEPLVFVHVALLPRVPESMEQINEHEDIDTGYRMQTKLKGENSTPGQSQPKAAAFYSITSTQPGLSGVDLGNFLIKRVVELLGVEFPQIETFATLSPIPRFRKWLEGKLRHRDDNNRAELSKFDDDTLFTQPEKERLRIVLQCESASGVPEALRTTLDTRWFEDQTVAEALKPMLMKLAARYLALEKRRGKPLDVVAKFHIRNGAEMYRLNYLADKSRKGMHNSAGLMVNYRYCLESIEANNVTYEVHGKIPVREGLMKWLSIEEQSRI